MTHPPTPSRAPAPDGLEAAKAALRRDLRQRRAGAHADPDLRAALGKQLRAVLPALSKGLCLAGYMPLPTEADPLPAMTAHVGPLCLPVVVGPASALIFRPWVPGAPLQRGLFGTQEPLEGPEGLPTCQPDLLLVPLLGFDAQGGRLGQGGGHYDRTLAALRSGPRPPRAIGLGYEAQRCTALPRGPHDAPLDAILTETGLHLPS